MDYQAPRGAIWAANAFAKLLDAAAAVYRAVSSPPVTAPNDCKTSTELRQYAMSIRHSDPSLSADLVAAANRYDDKQA
jgi:hypothetical protein